MGKLLLSTLMTAEALNWRGRVPQKSNNMHIVIFISLRCAGQLLEFKRFDLANINLSPQWAAVRCGRFCVSARSCGN